MNGPTGNYLFGSHPHGLLCFGAVAAFACEGANFSQIFPDLTPTLLTLQIFHQIPGDYYRSGNLPKETSVPSNIQENKNIFLFSALASNVFLWNQKR